MHVSLSDDPVRVRAAAILAQRQRAAIIRERYAAPRVVLSRDEADGLDDVTRLYLALSLQQEEAYQSTRRNVWTLFGGAKGGAKSVGGVRIAQRDIARSRDGVHLVLRRNLSDLLKTTKESYEKHFPPEMVLDKTRTEWLCINGWRIWFYAADERKDPNLEKIGGLEVTSVHADEVSQLSTRFYEGISATLRREAFDLATGEPMPHYIYATANPTPGSHWTKKYFIEPKTRRGEEYLNALGTRTGHLFIQSLPDDNPLLPPSYMSNAFGTMQGAMLKMLRYGDWDISESELMIIPGENLRAARIDHAADRDAVALGIDVGLGRPDRTTVYGVNPASEIFRLAIIEEYDTMRQVELLEPIIQPVAAIGGKVAIDAGSIGKGLVDRLSEIFPGTILPILFGSSPLPETSARPIEYENRRAQIFWWARIDILSNAITYEGNDDIDEDLANIFYMPDTSRILIEPKEEIKKRIGRSPDDADAFVLANVARRATITMQFTLPSRSHGRRRSTIPEGY